MRNAIYNDEEFSAYADRIDAAFDAWKAQMDADLRSIDEAVNVKGYIVELSDALIHAFEGLELVDKHDVYEVLLSYWLEVMSDDVYLVSVDGYEAARRTENIMGEYTSGKKKGQEKIVGWEGVLIPKALMEKVFFSAERRAIEDAQSISDETQSNLEEVVEEQTGDEGYLKDHLNDKDKVDNKSVTARLKELKKTDPKGEEYAVLRQYADLVDALAKQNKLIKEMNVELEAKVKAKYAKLTDEEILEVLVNRKMKRVLCLALLLFLLAGCSTGPEATPATTLSKEDYAISMNTDFPACTELADGNSRKAKLIPTRPEQRLRLLPGGLSAEKPGCGGICQARSGL